MKNTKYILMYILGTCIIITGIVVFVIGIVNMIVGADDSSSRFIVPSDTTIEFEESGRYIIYYEYDSAFNGTIYTTGDEDLTGLSVWLYDDSGEDIPIGYSTINSTYTINSRSGSSLFQFEIDEPTTLRIVSEYEDGDGPQVVFNISKEMVGIMFKGIGAPLGYLFGCGLLGFAIIIMTIVKHVNARKKHRLAISQ